MENIHELLTQMNFQYTGSSSYQFNLHNLDNELCGDILTVIVEKDYMHSVVHRDLGEGLEHAYYFEIYDITDLMEFLFHYDPDNYKVSSYLSKDVELFLDSKLSKQ